jgi:hypothetical protein
LDLVSLSPFEAGAFLWEAAAGQHSLTVVVKGTFALVPGELVLADSQDPLCEERHLEDSALASLYWSGDYAPVKRKVDLTLVGSAFAPGGQPVTSLVARLAVGDLVKSVRVTGERAWTLDGGNLVPGPPAPFARLPLRYERAGLSADNPVGFDPSAHRAAAGAPAAPNLERVDGRGVACFGPVAPSWRARRNLLDESAMFWAYGVVRAPHAGAPSLGPAPPRFDFAFFNSAPADQQLDLLRAGTPIVLENLHPQRPRLETRLAPIRPQVFRVPPADVPKGRVEEIILRCDSMWIDTDRGVVVLTWRGVADAPGGEARVGTLVVDADPQGKKLRWDRVERRFAEVHVPTQRLPGADAPRAPRVVAPLQDPLSVRYDGRRSADGGPTSAPVIAAPESFLDDPTNPIEAPPSDRAPTASIALKPRRPAPARPEIPSVRAGETVELGGPPRAAPARPVVAPPPPPPPVARPAPAAPTGPVPALTVPMRAGPAPRAPLPSRPLMMLGGPPAAAPASPSPAAPPATPAAEARRALAATKAPRPGARDAGPALRKDLTIDRYASIVAELGRAGTARGAVLKTHLLTEPGWIMVDQHWKKALAREAEEGGRVLLLAFDEAFLATQARLGKPVGVLEYARIQVGLERGQVGRVLGELELELGDLMRLQRVWAKRLADSAELGADLARAIDDARKAMG